MNSSVEVKRVPLSSYPEIILVIFTALVRFFNPYENFDAVENFRLVCKQWNDVANSSLLFDEVNNSPGMNIRLLRRVKNIDLSLQENLRTALEFPNPHIFDLSRFAAKCSHPRNFELVVQTCIKSEFAFIDDLATQLLISLGENFHELMPSFYDYYRNPSIGRMMIKFLAGTLGKVIDLRNSFNMLAAINFYLYQNQPPNIWLNDINMIDLLAKLSLCLECQDGIFDSNIYLTIIKWFRVAFRNNQVTIMSEILAILEKYHLESEISLSVSYLSVPILISAISGNIDFLNFLQHSGFDFDDESDALSKTSGNNDLADALRIIKKFIDNDPTVDIAAILLTNSFQNMAQNLEVSLKWVHNMVILRENVERAAAQGTLEQSDRLTSWFQYLLHTANYTI